MHGGGFKNSRITIVSPLSRLSCLLKIKYVLDDHREPSCHLLDRVGFALTGLGHMDNQTLSTLRHKPSSHLFLLFVRRAFQHQFSFPWSRSLRLSLQRRLKPRDQLSLLLHLGVLSGGPLSTSPTALATSEVCLISLVISSLFLLASSWQNQPEVVVSIEAVFLNLSKLKHF